MHIWLWSCTFADIAILLALINKLNIKVSTIICSFPSFPPCSMQDAPVECAVLFNKRVKLFMEKYITNNKGILGRVTHHVIRYEVQNRGSLHAHIILWVDPKDIERIASEICGMVPAEVDPSNSSSFIEPECPEQARLLHMILRKNMHTCGQVFTICSLCHVILLAT